MKGRPMKDMPIYIITNPHSVPYTIEYKTIGPKTFLFNE